MKEKYLNIILISSSWEMNHRKGLYLSLNNDLGEWSNVVFTENPFSIIVHTIIKFKSRLPKLFKNGRFYSEGGINIFTPVIIFHEKIWKKFKPAMMIDIFLLKFQMNRFIKNKYNKSKVILWHCDPYNFLVSKDLNLFKRVYDYYDNFEYNSDGVTDETRKILNQKLIEKSDLIFCTSKVLYEKAITANDNSYFLPNGHNLKFTDKSNNCEKITKDTMVIGYIGNIRDWINFDLIEELLRKLKDFQEVVFIGPVESNVKKKIEHFKKFENFRHIEKVPYEEIGNYIEKFDVGIIPFKINNFTEGVLPYKFFEYLASGIQIVSTALPGLEQFENFLNISYDNKEFIEYCINNSIYMKRSDPEILKKIIHESRWEKRSEFMNEKLRNIL